MSEFDRCVSWFLLRATDKFHTRARNVDETRVFVMYSLIASGSASLAWGSA